MNSLTSQSRVSDKKMIYLASPHSHTDSGVRQTRYYEALNCTSFLIENGFWVYSPIVSSHNLPCNSNESTICWEFWKEFDTELIRRMDEVWVLQIDGTKESKGVRAEVVIAKEMRKRIVSIWRNPSKRALEGAEYNCYEVTEWEVDKILGC